MIKKLKLSKATFYILYFHLTLIPLDVEAKDTQGSHVNEDENLTKTKSPRFRGHSQNREKNREASNQKDDYREYHEMRDDVITRYEEQRPALRQYKGRTYRKANGDGLESRARKFRDYAVSVRKKVEERNERVNNVGRQVVNGMGVITEIAIQETIESDRSRTLLSKLKDSVVQMFKSIFY